MVNSMRYLQLANMFIFVVNLRMVYRIRYANRKHYLQTSFLREYGQYVQMLLHSVFMGCTQNEYVNGTKIGHEIVSSLLCLCIVPCHPQSCSGCYSSLRSDKMHGNQSVLLKVFQHIVSHLGFDQDIRLMIYASI